MIFGRRAKAILFGSASFLAISGAAAAAQGRDINIPGEDLRLALDTYIRQAGVQLVYTVNDVRGQRSNPVQGSYQPSDALDEMLRGTILVANRDPSGAVIVSRRREQVPDPEPAGGPSPSESIVVTGSRIISDAANSPTPLTVVSTEQLQATTPSNIPDALNKLPVFSNSSSPTTSNTAGGNSSGNVLNLRRFGGQRTLVLLDGHRAPPSSADATVDVDTLPQMLVSRVDVVTGGASAVYGSDAVTGVVNFILDKTFTGVKVNANAGISDYGDGAEYQLGVAAGMPLFGGRGHIEGSFRHHHVDTVLVNARPYGSPANWVITGAGTAANPYINTEFATLNSFSFGGKIACSGTTAAPCAANGQQFVSPGVIGPFNSGTATKSASISIGGDGTYPTDVALSAMLKTDEAFGRFSYDINDTTNFYVQGIAAEAYYFNNWTNNYIQTGTSTPNIFFKDNPFLTPAARTLLANATGASQLVPNTFTLTEYLQPGRHFITRALNRNLSLTTGLTGTLAGKYLWDVFYTHGENRSKVDDPTNQSAAKMSAASDAVQLANGSIVCQVSQTQYANLYPGCVPLNPFGAGTITNDMYRYITIDTGFVMNNVLDDAGASISGELFNLPAGPVKGALSAEMRWLSYEVVGYAPQGFVDCTGLRLCRPETSNYLGSTSADLPMVSNNVWEFAGEIGIPLLRDMPLIQELSTDIAGRYTDYSTSGPVETWKIGLDWHVNDDVRFRATNSIDIRAPTLNDLFSPQQLGHGGFSDLHTGNTIQNVLSISQGNANLKPEVARTYTAGVVLTPSFFQGFTASFDWYKITLKNAISSVGGNSPGVQQVCEASNGTSPLCSLFVRPLPYSDRTPANYPTAVLSQKLNAALNEIEGMDVELNYGFPVASLLDDVAGDMNLRVLLNNQPVDNTQNYTNAPITTSTAPKTRITTFVAYNLYSWKFNLTHRWYSGFPRSNQIGLVYFQVPRGDAHDYFDINVAKSFQVDDANLETYFSVQNLLNSSPNINPINTTVPGLYAAGYQPSGGGRIDGVDNIGRYFTIGVRARM
jgi:outer membrane receptor protein involved in Fe transport